MSMHSSIHCFKFSNSEEIELKGLKTFSLKAAFSFSSRLFFKKLHIDMRVHTIL